MVSVDPVVLRCWPFTRLFTTLIELEMKRAKLEIEGGNSGSNQDFAATDFSPLGC